MSTPTQFAPKERTRQRKGGLRLLGAVAALAAALILPSATPAEAAEARPSCGNGASSTCLHAQIAWEAAKALSAARADGTSTRMFNNRYYESDWRSPSYPSSDQNALDHIATRLPRSYWGDYSSAYHGGQCFFFAHDVTYRASHAYLRLPSTVRGLYSEGTADRSKWKAGDVLQYNPDAAGGPHTAILWKVNARDGYGRATSVEVIDSNWDVGNGSERIIRHTLTVPPPDKGGKAYLSSNWHAFGSGKYT